MNKYVKQIMACIIGIAVVEILLFIWFSVNRIGNRNFTLYIITNIGVVLHCPLVALDVIANERLSPLNIISILMMVVILAILAIPILDVNNII